MSRGIMIIKKFAWLSLLPLLAACAAAPDCRDAACAEEMRIAQAVLARLNEGNALKTDQLRVEVFDHKIYLRGMVDTEREYRAAEEIARATPNVMQVVNALGVRNYR